MGSNCGDSVVDGECDDGNTDGGDGCAAVCTVEDGFTCAGAPSICDDIVECTDGTADCDPNAICDNLEGTYDCICDEGFVGDGYTCEPEEETSSDDTGGDTPGDGTNAGGDDSGNPGDGLNGGGGGRPKGGAAHTPHRRRRSEGSACSGSPRSLAAAADSGPPGRPASADRNFRVANTPIPYQRPLRKTDTTPD